MTTLSKTCRFARYFDICDGSAYVIVDLSGSDDIDGKGGLSVYNAQNKFEKIDGIGSIEEIFDRLSVAIDNHKIAI